MIKMKIIIILVILWYVSKFLQSKMNYRKLCLNSEIISAKRFRVKLIVPCVLLVHTEVGLKLPLNIAFDHLKQVKVVACEYATAMMILSYS